MRVQRLRALFREIMILSLLTASTTYLLSFPPNVSNNHDDIKAVRRINLMLLRSAKVPQQSI